MLTMESFLTVLFLLILSGTVGAEMPTEKVDTSSSKWYRSSNFDNKSSKTGNVLTSRSLINCARACEADKTCQSFFFMKNKQLDNCVILSTVLNQVSPDLIVSETDSAYYIMENEQTTTTASTTTTPSTTATTTTTPSTTTTPAVTYPTFSCPADDTVFRTVRLSDNTLMTYRVFKTTKYPEDAAESCLIEGGFLARVTTVAKMNMVVSLASCPENSAFDYYVDGSNFHSWPTWDSWITSNNETIPINGTFWEPNSPSSSDTDHCVRMDHNKGHKFNNVLCTHTYYYICQK